MHWLAGITHRSRRENRLGEKTERKVFAAVLMSCQAPGLTELPVELAYPSKSVLGSLSAWTVKCSHPDVSHTAQTTFLWRWHLPMDR